MKMFKVRKSNHRLLRNRRQLDFFFPYVCLDFAVICSGLFQITQTNVVFWRVTAPSAPALTRFARRAFEICQNVYSTENRNWKACKTSCSPSELFVLTSCLWGAGSLHSLESATCRLWFSVVFLFFLPHASIEWEKSSLYYFFCYNCTSACW